MMKLKDFDLSRLLVLELKLERCEVNQPKCKKVKTENVVEKLKVADVAPVANVAPAANVAPVADVAPATSNSDVCWGCLEEGDLSDMHKPFNEHDDTYADLIMYCFSLKVTEDVKSSKRKYFMCKSCITKLQEAVKFRRQLEIAQSFFNNLFPDQPEEPTHDPDIHGSLLVPTSFSNFGDDDCMIVDEARPSSPQEPLQTNARNHLGRLYKMLPKDVTHVQSFCKAMDELDATNGCRCPFCKEVFPTIVARRRHMRQTYGGRIAKYTCEECGKPFGANSHINGHVRNLHLKERAFECNVCGKKFFRRNDLGKHMNLHAHENFQCPTCFHVFKTLNELRHHQLQCTDDRHGKNPNIQEYDEINTESNQDYMYSDEHVYNQNESGLDLQNYMGLEGANDSNSAWSEPDEPMIARVTPIMTGPSSSSGGTYVIMNHNQFQI